MSEKGGKGLKSSLKSKDGMCISHSVSLLFNITFLEIRFSVSRVFVAGGKDGSSTKLKKGRKIHFDQGLTFFDSLHLISHSQSEAFFPFLI
jgi:DNA-directed RNA polymerase II subunit RPB4